MFYDFPIINHYNDVLSVIKDSPEFGVKYDEENRLINICYINMYVINYSDEMTYEESIRRECRGITFDMDSGRVVARKFQKFFNLNERPETQVGNIDITVPHILMQKLDGSMVVPIFVKDKMVWHTKRGSTTVSKQVDLYTSDKSNYEAFARKMWVECKTPIFEWCSRQNRVVVDHQKPSLTLTAIRDNVTGHYSSYEEMISYGNEYGFPVVSAWNTENALTKESINEIRNLVDDEGRVIRFNNGHMLKIKGEWYCNLHKNADLLRFEKDIVRFIIDEQIDDLKPFLPDYMRDDITKYEQIINEGIIREATTTLDTATRIYGETNGDRKKMAQIINNELSLLTLQKGFHFYAINNMDMEKILEFIKSKMRQRTTTSSRLEEIRYIWGGVHWSDIANGFQEE